MFSSFVLFALSWARPDFAPFQNLRAPAEYALSDEEDSAPLAPRKLAKDKAETGKEQELPVTTTVKEFFIFAPLARSDYCFDYSRLCDSFWSSAQAIEYDPTSYDYAVAYAARGIMCEISSRASSYLNTAVVATGEFSVEQAGNEGAVKAIDLSTDLTSSQYLSVYSSTGASAEATTYARAYAWTDAPKMCEYIRSVYGYWYPHLKRYYKCADSKAKADSNARADAQSFGSSASRSFSSNLHDYSTEVAVEGKNLQSFISSVNLGAYGYAYAHSSSSSEVLASAYSRAFADSFSEVCTQVRKYYRYWYWYYYAGSDEFCRKALAVAEGDVNAFAEAWANSYAGALAQFEVDVSVVANFTRVPGSDDIISVAGEVDNGVSYGSAYAGCSA